MKSQFPGHYRPTAGEFAEMWRTAHFICDANVLLNLYRVTEEAARTFLDVLEKLGDRVWIPHQVASEYLDNRLGVLQQRATMIGDLDNDLERLGSQLIQALRRARRHPGLDEAFLVERAEEMLQEVRDYIARRRTEEPAAFGEDIFGDDWILDRLTSVLDARVGEPYSRHRLEELYAEAEQRYMDERPPGFEDIRKEAPERFADVILWKQTIEHARDVQLPIILVTEEEKGDWWWLFQGQKVGPRPELVEEIRREAGVGFYLYSSARFVEEAGRLVSQDVAEETIGELTRAPRRAFVVAEDEDAENAVAVPPPLAEDGYRGPQVCKIVGITYRQLDYWVRTNLIRPSVADAKGSGYQRRYSYRDIVEAKVITSMLEAGISLQSARRSIDVLRMHLGEDVEGASLVISADGRSEFAKDADAVAALLRAGNATRSVVSLSGIIAAVDSGIWRLIRGDNPEMERDETEDHRALED